MICRYCSLPVNLSDAVVTHSYWQGLKFVCHKDCKVTGEKGEAIDCQTIDADCNDCRHFERGELVKRWLSAIVDGKSAKKLVNMGIVKGHCANFNRPTEAYPHMSTGWECFEHRRSNGVQARRPGRDELTPGDPPSPVV